jgi:hypothetical protein
MTQHEFEPEVIEALAVLREIARIGKIGTYAGIAQAIDTLDNAGVFARLDEQTDYASAEEILAEITTQSRTPEEFRTIQDINRGADYGPDPAEWGDTTSADMARHQGYAAASGLGKLERVPGTDTLRPAPEDAGEWSEDVVRAAFPEHGHAFRSPHSDEVCYATEECEVTYGEHRVARRALTQADCAAHNIGWHPRTPDDLRQSQETSAAEEAEMEAERIRMRQNER